MNCSVAARRVSAARVALLLLAALPSPVAVFYLAQCERVFARLFAAWALVGRARSFTPLVFVAVEGQVVCCVLLPTALAATFWAYESRRGPLSLPSALATTPFSPRRYLLRRLGVCMGGVAASCAPAYAIILGHGGLWLFYPAAVFALLAVMVAVPLPALVAFNPESTSGDRLRAVAMLVGLAWGLLAHTTIYTGYGFRPLYALGVLLRLDNASPLWRHLGMMVFGGVCMVGTPWAWCAWRRMFREEAP